MRIKPDPDGAGSPPQTPHSQPTPTPWRGRAISIHSSPSPPPLNRRISPVQHYQDIQVKDEMDLDDTSYDLPTRPIEFDHTEQTGGEDTMHKLSAGTRQIIKCIQQLETLSLKELTSLPIFVVVGDQSAGKSSILEAISGLKLPRGEGTCTRCPFRITTTSSGKDPWICKVSVHQKYRYDPSVQAGLDSQYDHWTADDDVSVTEIATVYEKEHLEAALRRAQLAILNPKQHPSEFINLDITPCLASADLESDGHIAVAFSPNWVALEITGPELPELSLYDLPGAINVHAEDDKQHLVAFIETLMKSYMCEKNTLVLLACPMNADIETSTAYRFITQSQALGRCMGVRTKPDLIEKITQKRLQQELPLLEGKKFRLAGGGWFITRQCSQEEVEQGNISHAEAREIERQFFAQGNWAKILGKHQDRLGIPSLQAALSERLTNHIKAELPVIMQTIHEKRQKVEKDLEKYPPPDESAVATVVREINTFRATVAAEMDQEAVGPEAFYSKFRHLFRNLSEIFLKSSPELMVKTPGYVPSNPSESDEEDSEDASPTKRARVTADRSVNTTPTHGTPQSRQRRTTKRGGSSAVLAPHIKVEFGLGDLSRQFDSAPGANIPGQPSEKVIRQLMLQSIAGWNAGVDVHLLQAVRRLFSVTIEKCYKCLDTRRGTAFYDAVARSTARFCEERIQESCKSVQAALASEMSLPFTMSKVFRKELAANSEIYKTRRNIQRVTEYYGTQDEGSKKPNKAERVKRACDDKWVMATLEEDPYERELAGFVRVLAYYNTSYPQLVDSLFKNIHFHLIKSFDTLLFDRLNKDLKIDDKQHCEQLLVADHNIQRQRQALLVEQQKLDKALQELKRLEDGA